MEDECKLNKFFFPTTTLATICCTIESLPSDTCWFVFKKKNSHIATLVVVIIAFLWPTCFRKEFKFDIVIFITPLKFIVDFAFHFMHLASTPTTYFAQSNFIAHVS